MYVLVRLFKILTYTSNERFLPVKIKKNILDPYMKIIIVIYLIIIIRVLLRLLRKNELARKELRYFSCSKEK